MAELMPSNQLYKAKPEQVILFRVDAWDINCPQHISVRLDHQDVSEIIKQKDLESERLREEVRRLKG